MEEILFNSKPEFQVVIIVEYDDGRMFPLTEGCPKSLLPIANRKLLAYQLDMLSKSGVLEVLIVSPKDYHTQLSRFIADYRLESDNGISQRYIPCIELVIVDQMLGSADGLRAIRERIRGPEFICISFDFFSEVALGDLVRFHKSKSSDLTMLLTAIPADESDKKSKKINIDEDDQEFIGRCDDGRIAIKLPTLDVSNDIVIDKPLLNRCKSLTMRNDLCDMGVYVMSAWILEYLMLNRKISNIRMDLVPLLINMQFQTTDNVIKSFPVLVHKKRTLHSVESWLKKNSHIDTNNSDSNPDLAKVMAHDLLESYDKSETQSPSNSEESLSNTIDLIRCFSMVYDTSESVIDGIDDKLANLSIYNTNCKDVKELLLIQRLTTIQSYTNLNRDLPNHSHDNNTPWPRIKGYQKKELSVVGEGCEMGEKVTLTKCTVGNTCKIGNKSRLNSCVVMDNVTIGDGCTLQNCVICSGAIIEANCSLNECFIGREVKIEEKTKLKNETLVSS